MMYLTATPSLQRLQVMPQLDVSLKAWRSLPWHNSLRTSSKLDVITQGLPITHGSQAKPSPAGGELINRRARKSSRVRLESKDPANAWLAVLICRPDFCCIAFLPKCLARHVRYEHVRGFLSVSDDLPSDRWRFSGFGSDNFR